MTFTNIIIKVIIYKAFNFDTNAYNIIIYFIILKICPLNIKNPNYILL